MVLLKTQAARGNKLRIEKKIIDEAELEMER